MLTTPSTIQLDGSLTHVILALKRFLLIQRCPPAWHSMNLYVFRDEQVAFYVGQSSVAFDRVRTHLLDGYKGRSTIGRFVLCNWPYSMNFTIELLSCQADRFAGVNFELNAAEQQLIQQMSPCFNIAKNVQPTPLPERYAPPTASPQHLRSPNRMMREAQRMIQAEEKKLLLSELQSEANTSSDTP
jgi:hypothetical protein